MQLILIDSDLPQRCVVCPDCNWHGKGNELNRGETFELTNITELFCPSCKKYIGFIQHESEQENGELTS